LKWERAANLQKNLLPKYRVCGIPFQSLKPISFFNNNWIMPGKKGNKGGGGGGKKPDQPKATESAPESAFKFNFGGGNDQGEARIPTFDFGSKDSPLIPMMQKKLNSLIGKGSGYFESLPAPVQERIKGLKGLHRKKGRTWSPIQEGTFGTPS